MAEHRLTAGVGTVHWGYLDATLPPVLTIDPGDVVTVETVSGAMDQISPNGYLRPELRAIHRALSPAPGPHILSGPIFVCGAKPGDLLKIDILDVAVRDDWGYNITAPGKGVLSDEFETPSLTHFSIDCGAGTVTTPWGATIRARPFFGVIATAPAREDGCLSSVAPGYFGGNMDNKELIAGSTLYLPVSVEGGLVSVGDGHALQGNGEVCLTAVETGLTGRMRIDLIRNEAATGPYAETPDHLIAMAFDANLEVAISQALRSAVSLVQTRTGMSAHEAYVLCSIGADICVTQLVNIQKGVHVMISKRLLVKDGVAPHASRQALSRGVDQPITL